MLHNKGNYTKMRVFYLLGILSLLGCSGRSVSEISLRTLSGEDSVIYISEGKRIAAVTFDTLSAVLGREIAGGGPLGAVSFCNLQALDLTAAYALDTLHIRRVSGSYRNPANAPDSLEREAIRNFTLAAVKGDPLAPYLRVEERFVHFFAPILLKPQCVLCHGGPNEIPEAVSLRIDSLYPNDLARNYAPGDFRGMWHVRFGEAAKTE